MPRSEIRIQLSAASADATRRRDRRGVEQKSRENRGATNQIVRLACRRGGGLFQTSKFELIEMRLLRRLLFGAFSFSNLFTQRAGMFAIEGLCQRLDKRGLARK